MKKCPFCAEEIQEEAVKCKHCGEFLIDAELRGMKTTSGVEWYHSTWMVIFWILILGPFAIPLIKKNPQLNDKTKSILIIMTIFITVFALALLVLFFIFLIPIAMHFITGQNILNGF